MGMDQAEKDMVIERAIWAFGNLKLSRYGMRVAMRALRALHMAESPDDIKELQRLVIVGYSAKRVETAIQ